ncbi:MAG: Rrf2 family transcriptional regulator [Clostridia bacterium]|nr:Rrf2 family transcriptional regulator [Clostridia bacterium]
MKISTRGRYGLKAMVDIAANCREGCVSLKSIAERTNLSESYLEQLIAPLKRAGLVKSTRGANGGYILGRNAEDISVGDVLRVVEGPLELVECLSKNETCGLGDCSCCSTKDVWARLSDSVSETADNINLSELI